MKKESEADDKDEALKLRYAESKVVSSCFALIDLKILLETNGHEWRPFCKDHVREVKNCEKALKLVIDRAEENNKKKQDEEKMEKKLKK